VDTGAEDLVAGQRRHVRKGVALSSALCEPRDGTEGLAGGVNCRHEGAPRRTLSALLTRRITFAASGGVPDHFQQPRATRPCHDAEAVHARSCYDPLCSCRPQMVYRQLQSRASRSLKPESKQGKDISMRPDDEAQARRILPCRKSQPGADMSGGPPTQQRCVDAGVQRWGTTYERLDALWPKLPWLEASSGSIMFSLCTQLPTC
jgi:hypothetical protein